MSKIFFHGCQVRSTRPALLQILAFSLMGCLLYGCGELTEQGVFLPSPPTDTPATVTPTPEPMPEPTPVATVAPTAPERMNNSLGMEFVRLPAGTFMMGSPPDEAGRKNDEGQFEVTLTEAFYLQTTEVTQTQWEAVMGNNPSQVKAPNRPVETVSWNDAQIYIQKLNQRGEGEYRLPTEAEWEYAARAGTQTAYACGNDPGCLETMDWDMRNSDNKTQPVAQKQPNAWGLYDMHGNVHEWVQDWYGDYPTGTVSNPQGPESASRRALRGGSFADSRRDLRSAERSSAQPEIRYFRLGLRLVRVR